LSDKVIKKRDFIIYNDKYVELRNAEYETTTGYKGNWVYIERSKKQKAAVIIPIIDGNKILLIKQYRIPVESFVIEFPAGLIEEGEDVRDAALRELEEETGFKGEIVDISQPLPTSPGLSSEEIYIVRINVGGKGNKNLEDVEDIENIIIPLNELNVYLKNLEKNGFKIDSKVWALSLGLIF